MRKVSLATQRAARERRVPTGPAREKESAREEEEEEKKGKRDRSEQRQNGNFRLLQVRLPRLHRAYAAHAVSSRRQDAASSVGEVRKWARSLLVDLIQT